MKEDLNKATPTNGRLELGMMAAINLLERRGAEESASFLRSEWAKILDQKRPRK